MERKSCIIKINEQLGSLTPGIYHLSFWDQVYVIRDKVNKEVGSKDKGLPNDYDQLKQNTYVELITWVNIPSLNIKADYWPNFLKIVNKLPKGTPINSNIFDLVSMMVIEGLELEDKRNVIPNTELRMIYRLIGDDLAKTLSTSFIKSIDKLKEYKSNQKFKPDNGKKTKSNLHNATLKLQDYFERLGKIPITDTEKYLYLDYELSPLRTPNGLYETGGGAKKSGIGGIDIFCQNTETKNPVLIEYKSEKDHSLFYALIQVLTYASELSTPSQKERLRTNYIDYFRECWIGDKIELCIMFDTPIAKKSDKKKQEIEYVSGICKDLMKYKEINTHIASISLVEVNRSNDSYLFKKP